jgi:hypothetical protein
MSPVRVNYWAEGPTDRAVARRLIEAVGGEAGADYSRRRGAASGKAHLDANLLRYNAAAQIGPWLVLRDADSECAMELVSRLLPRPAPHMRFRVVVPAIEAWLLADRDAIAQYLGVDARRIPAAPEQTRDVKGYMIAVSRHSRIRTIRDEFPPAPKSGRREGAGYATSMIEFIGSTWSPDRACNNSPSLRRAIDRLSTVTRPT